MLYEYWERFKQLSASCPQHQISDQLLIQYFYEGLLIMDRNMIDAASGGAFMNNTLEGAKKLIVDMAENAQQFGTRHDVPGKVNKANMSSIDRRLDIITYVLEKLISGQVLQVKACGIYAKVGHPTDMCPILQEDTNEQVNAVGGFQGHQQRKYDPYSNSYNLGWRDHPNFSYGNRNPNFPQQPVQPPFPLPPTVQPATNSSTSLASLIKNLVESVQLDRQETKASIKSLENQIFKLAVTVGNLEANQGKLPSQVKKNPRENACAVTLKNERELYEVEKKKNLVDSSEKEV